MTPTPVVSTSPVPTTAATDVPTPTPTTAPTPTPTPTPVPEYTKELFHVDFTDTRAESVNGNTCKVDMQLFTGKSEGEYFNGNILSESSVVTKTYKDGRIAICSRFILEGKDDTDKDCRIFIEGQKKVNEQGEEEFVRPIIITTSESLAWMESADIKTEFTESGSGEKKVRFMLNVANQGPVAPRPVVKPDTKRKYTQEIFRFAIGIGATDEVKGTAGNNASMIHFTAESDFDTFKGRTLFEYANADTRVQYKGQTQTLSARYILEGTDANGKPCRVYVENNGIDNGTISTEPIIITDCPDYAWIEEAPLHGTVTWSPKFEIHMWTTKDGK